MKNIIVILSDQQRWDSVGCYTRNSVTPNIDMLASEGAMFSNAFTPQPLCGPARSCIQTGLYATQTGCYVNDIPLKENAITIPKLLKQKGYDTAYIGKWHLASDIKNGEDYIFNAPPRHRRGGFDYWMASDVLELTSDAYSGFVFNTEGEKVNFNKYRVNAIGDFALDFLDSRKEKDSPFIMFVSFIEPHQQNSINLVQPPKDSEDLLNYDIPKDFAKGVGNWESNIQAYMKCCKRIDDYVGKIVYKLKQLSIYEDSLIIYTSDHGCHFNTRCKDYKRTCHDASIRIPIIIRGGPFTNMGNREDFASLNDIAPTILNFAKCEVPSYMTGRNLSLYNKGEDCMYIQISERCVARAIRTPKYCYCICAKDTDPIKSSFSHEYEEELLYDLESDPNELTNLISDPKYIETKKILKEKLISCAINAGEFIESIRDCETTY